MKMFRALAVLLLSGFAPAFAGSIEGELVLPKEIPKDEVALWLVGDELRGKPPGDTPRVSQQGAKFAPAFLVISAGQSVEMPNDDDIAHNVFSYSGPKNFNLGIYPKGETKVIDFDVPGFVEIYCSIHRQMSAIVFIAPSPVRTQTDENGGFRFEEVPPGEYTLMLWAKELGEHEYALTVSGNRPTNVKYSPEAHTK